MGPTFTNGQNNKIFQSPVSSPKSLIFRSITSSLWFSLLYHCVPEVTWRHHRTNVETCFETSLQLVITNLFSLPMLLFPDFITASVSLSG